MTITVALLLVLAAVVIGAFVGWKLAIREREERFKKRKEIAQEIWRRYNRSDIELPDEE